jgi:hypothetical protein
MKGSYDPPPPADGDDLDELIRQFEASGYAPQGADVDEAAPPSHGPHGHGAHGHGPAGDPAVRRFEHRGHDVEIVTRYAVTIDGASWEQPMQVHNDGTVTYHGLPQYVVPSAVDLVRAVIDNSYEAPAEIRDAVRSAEDES